MTRRVTALWCVATPSATVSLMNDLTDELFTPWSGGKKPPLLTPTSDTLTAQCEGSASRIVYHLQEQNPAFPCAAGYSLESSSSSLILLRLWYGLR